jgi:hypothetical protein
MKKNRRVAALAATLPCVMAIMYADRTAVTSVGGWIGTAGGTATCNPDRADPVGDNDARRGASGVGGVRAASVTSTVVAARRRMGECGVAVISETLCARDTDGEAVNAESVPVDATTAAAAADASVEVVVVVSINDSVMV